MRFDHLPCVCNKRAKGDFSDRSENLAAPVRSSLCSFVQSNISEKVSDGSQVVALETSSLSVLWSFTPFTSKILQLAIAPCFSQLSYKNKVRVLQNKDSWTTTVRFHAEPGCSRHTNLLKDRPRLLRPLTSKTKASESLSAMKPCRSPTPSSVRLSSRVKFSSSECRL